MGSNGFRGQRVGLHLRVGAGWLGKNRSIDCRVLLPREGKATPPPSATVATAPPLLRRPRIEVLLFHLASSSSPRHPFLFLNDSLAPFFFLQDAKICGGEDALTPVAWSLQEARGNPFVSTGSSTPTASPVRVPIAPRQPAGSSSPLVPGVAPSCASGSTALGVGDTGACARPRSDP